MINSEVAELRRLFNKDNCSVSRICGCYVDGEKNIKSIFARTPLAMPDEDLHKYMEVLKKTLSGRIEKNLINASFSIDAEDKESMHQRLMKLRSSGLKDEALLQEFFEEVIAKFDHPGNYLILVAVDAYDVPGKTSDGITMTDASDEVYSFLLVSICPVDLEKAALSYKEEDGVFSNLDRQWILDKPMRGFLFPAFTDRTTDIHSTLIYTKDAGDPGEAFFNELLGCTTQQTALEQKDAFRAIIEETFADKLTYNKVKDICEDIKEIQLLAEAEKADDPVLGKERLKETILPKDSFEKDPKKQEEYKAATKRFEKAFDNYVGEGNELKVKNISIDSSLKVETEDAKISIKADRTELLEIREIDGRKFVLIPLEGQVTINGITAG